LSTFIKALDSFFVGHGFTCSNSLILWSLQTLQLSCCSLKQMLIYRMLMLQIQPGKIIWVSL
jgi:hypothetical protein